MKHLHVSTATLVAFVISLSPAGAQGRIVHDTLHSRALVGNPLGDSPDREVLIYLPPSYDHSPSRRFPVLYLLHGSTTKPIEWLDGSYPGLNVAKAMDSLAAADHREYIIVMPDADNALGGSYYLNSGVSGRWEDAIAHELVEYIDTRYRTLARRESRGLAGHSMGGFGVLFLAPRHPDVFGAAYAMSACCLGFLGNLGPSSPRWLRNARAMADTTRPESGVPVWRGDALTAAMVPPTRHPPFIGWLGLLPFQPSDNGLAPDSSVLATWRDRLPLERVDHDRAALARLRAFALDVGRADSGIVLGVRAYANELRRAGVRHELFEYDGDHLNHVYIRFEQVVLPFFAKNLEGTNR